MFNRNGKKIEWWWRELGLPRELVLPKSSWSFRFICPPLSEAIQTELKTSSVSTAGNSYCWHVILIFFHYIITTLSLRYHYIIHYSINGVLFHLECLFHCFMFAVGCSLAAGCIAGIPSIVPPIPSGTARRLSSSLRSGGASEIDPYQWGSCNVAPAGVKIVGRHAIVDFCCPVSPE